MTSGCGSGDVGDVALRHLFIICTQRRDVLIVCIYLNVFKLVFCFPGGGRAGLTGVQPGKWRTTVTFYLQWRSVWS